MKTVITGRHVGVTESMKGYAQEKVDKLGRYFDRVTQARVTMDIDHDRHRVEIQLEVTRGVSLVGKAEALDMYAACDLAEQKLAQQLRRFNQRLKDHHRGEPGPVRTGSGKGAGAGRGRGAAAQPSPEEATYEDVVEAMKDGEPEDGQEKPAKAKGKKARGGAA